MYSRFIEGKLLKDVSTLGIGGPARFFIDVKTVEEMQEVLRFCFREKLAYFILGKGSNCLFDDRGFDGLIIQNKIDFLNEGEKGLFHVGAGYSFSLLGVQTARKGFTGLEFAAGIPATVGGAVFMNAGAQGAETCACLTSVDFVTPEGSRLLLKKEDLHFAYRISSFQKMQGAIVAATFQLVESKEAKEKQRTLLDYRIRTQPYQDKSAGCIFRNPIAQSAGALIEKSGLKGFTIGGAEVSTMHANFLINKKDATQRDLLELIKYVKTKVKDEQGVDLEEEVRLIPYSFQESAST